MTDLRSYWRAIYAPLLGKALSDVVLMPITADTLTVAEARDQQVIGFSGATLFSFEEGHSLRLTWDQIGDEFGLISFSELEAEFRPLSLDSIRAGYDGDWGRVRGKALRRVELLCFEDMPDLISGAAHVFASDDGDEWLCVATAYGEEIAAGDDLLVCLNRKPNGYQHLVTHTVIQ